MLSIWFSILCSYSTVVATIVASTYIYFNMDDSTDHKLLINDEDVEDTELFYQYDQDEDTTNNVSKLLGPLLGTNQKNIYSTNSVLEGSLTLRECNKAYGDYNGYKYSNNDLPEFDRCTTKGCISPLRRFDNIVGHFSEFYTNKNISKFKTLCLKPEILFTLKELGESIKIELGSSIRRGRLWNLQGCNMCTSSTTGNWIYRNEELDSKLSTMMDIVSVSFPSPLSAHTHHAWLESEDAKDVFKASLTFKQPEETTAVPGLLGTLQNNQLIDLAQEDSGENINAELRYQNLDIPGFLCAGHTAHSTEAGRVRRVCDKVGVRILNSKLIAQLEKGCQLADGHNKDKKEWLLWCMGKATYCSTDSILVLRNFFILCSKNTIHVPTLYINLEMHTVLISISSGVLLRKDANNLLVSTVSLYSDKWPDNKYTPEFPPLDTDKGFYFYFSSYFQLIPYIAFDRPPRTVIASVQSIQAVSTPYGAGTSSIAPTSVSKPLVSTPLIENILNSNDCGIPDNVPGQDLLICFANFNDTNEDSIMINEGSIARGLYSYMGYSAHVVNTTEKIPDPEQYVHIKNNRWWKSYSRRQTEPIVPVPTSNSDNKSVPILAGGDGRGRIVSTSITQNGQISVKCTRYSTSVTGDKLASGHGQKGVIKLIKETNMPWGIDENGEPIIFDIVMSLSSMTNRLTVGQYYEAVTAVKATREGRRIIVKPSQSCNDHTETILYDGKTGELIERESENGTVPVMATWGISKVWQMTQLTWDKQHYTHNTSGKSSITTAIGRTAGGGIKFGEMDNHAIDASGLYQSCKEMKMRINTIDSQMCTRCEEFIDTCSCGEERALTNVSIPWSQMVFNFADVLTTGYVTKYKLCF